MPFDGGFNNADFVKRRQVGSILAVYATVSNTTRTMQVTTQKRTINRNKTQ
jgi:hypothetical protein